MADETIPWNPITLGFERPPLPSRDAVARAIKMLDERMGPVGSRLTRTDAGVKATFDCAVLLIAELLEKRDA